jgi:hypothetical protein
MRLVAVRLLGWGGGVASPTAIGLQKQQHRTNGGGQKSDQNKNNGFAHHSPGNLV